MLIDRTLLNQELSKSLDAIAERLIAAYLLKYDKKVDNLNSPLLRWLDFRLRYIEPAPRQLIYSDKFPMPALPPDAQRALEHLGNLIKKGDDLNPYQGRGLIDKNDTSGENHSKRTDLLWADWDIFHFHLNDLPIPKGRFFSYPADYLAFCLVGSDVVAVIDVIRHPDFEGFSDISLVETIGRSWPHYLEGKRLRGISADAPMTNQNIHTLRTKGINYSVGINGNAYMLGSGFSSAGTASSVTMREMYISRCVSSIAEEICIEDNQFLSPLIPLGIENPKFVFEVTERGLVLYESQSQIAFLLPRMHEGSGNSHYASLQELVLPQWALQKLV